jgi:hypothetical protein
MKKIQILAPAIFFLLFSLCQISVGKPWPEEGLSPSWLLSADSSDVDSSRTRPTSEPGGQPVVYFYEPFPMDPGSHVFQLGGSFSLLPYPDMEQELPIPALDVQYKLGLSKNLALDATLSTNIYSNLLHGGLQLQTRLGRFSCGLGNHVGGVYGFIKREKVFDRVDAYALFDMMIMRLGYRFDEFSLSLSFVTTYIFKSHSFVNGMTIPGGPEGSINDYWVTWAIEQPFLKRLHLSIGMSLGYTRSPYQSWMLYNTLDEWIFDPEFFFAIQI